MSATGTVQESGTSDASAGAAATLYTIPGSHACRTATLMLEHKGVAHRTVELPTGAHSFAVRALGFPGHPTPIRSLGGRTPARLRLLDRLGTVPALRYGAERVQTNTAIVAFLERIVPEPPLYPADPQLRASVEEARRWGDEPLQMLSRRLALAGGLRGLLQDGGGEGRLGALLSRRAPVRRVANSLAGRGAFEAVEAEPALLRELPGALDRIDAWIEAGVLGRAQSNAADYAIVPCLALLDYRLDLRSQLQERASYALLERLLPPPGP